MWLWLDTIKIKRKIKKDYKSGSPYTMVYFKDSTFEKEYKWIEHIKKFVRKNNIPVYFLHDIVYHEVRITYKRKEDQ